MAQGPWTDLYALGATVHFMLTGEAPTPAVMRVVNDLRQPLAAAGAAAFPKVGAKFLAAIDWTAAVKPSDRPQSVEALRQALADDTAREPAGGRAALRPVVAARARGAGADRARRARRRRLDARDDDADVRRGGAAARKLADAGGTCRAGASGRAAGARAGRRAAGHSARRPAPPAPASATLSAPEATVAAAKPDKAPAPALRPAAPKRPPVAKTTTPDATTPAGAETLASASRRPSEVCSGRNFISRALCINRQCQVAGSRLQPECVEARRIDEQLQRRMDR